MKKTLVKSFAGLFVVFMLGIVAFAQTAKRIDFAKEGSNSLVWEEKVGANSSKSFVFAAKKGQKLKLSFIDDTNQGSMDLGKLSVEPNGDGLDMDVEVTKDYTFSVSNNTKKSTSFRISISLENAKNSAKSALAGSNSNSVRVQFAKGATSTSITKDIPANGSIDFLLNVKKGQTMGFTVGYDFKDDDVNYALYEPNSKDVTMSAGPKEPQEFAVKMSGDHRLTVNNTTKKKITITLYVDIQ